MTFNIYFDSPKKYVANGSTLKNICYLKTYIDANLIAEQSVDKNVVIIGTSFIGIDVHMLYIYMNYNIATLE